MTRYIKTIIPAATLLFMMTYATAQEPAAEAPVRTVQTEYRGVVIPLPWHQVLFLNKGDRVDVLVTFNAKLNTYDEAAQNPKSDAKASDKKKGAKSKTADTPKKPTGTSTEQVTATIMQNVEIGEVYKPADNQSDGAVMLKVNPVEAQFTALSEKQGEIKLALRDKDDTELRPLELSSFRKLFR